MSLADAFNRLIGLAQEAQKAEVLQLAHDGRTAHVRIGSSLQPVELGPKLRQFTLNGLGDVIALALAWEQATGRTSVWHGESACSGASVTVIYDNDARDEWARMPLIYSPAFIALADLCRNAEGMTQAALIKKLRFDLGVETPSQLEPFRRLDWMHSSTAQGVIERGHESMGNTVNAMAQGVDKIPTTLDVIAPVYRQRGADTMLIIQCCVELDVQHQRILVVPRPHQMEGAIDSAHAWIQRHLVEAFVEAGAEIPVYYGVP